ncbi:uncharacterized protein [Drosophila pseudoobscura]|uniref:Uncharacterized protein isoform X5 n=1 Tax=Drosophila pseudoobscura pseudoobscura TaxID=46245 RepID=A0A6I8WAK3_DROPS|nr:uncharacterized protein LOC6901991 isoform X5 [Drosophila pseudoobscura]
MSSPNNSPNKKNSLQCESRISLRRSGGTQNDLVNKLQHLRPGFGLGAPVRRYLPAVFGVIDGGTHPRSILRDQTHQTDATEVKNFRQAHPRRQSRGRQQLQIANVPEENIADVSAPSFEMKKPSQRSNMVEAPVASGHTVETVYTEIFDSFPDPRDMMTPGTSLQIRDKSLGQKTTHRKVTTHRDSNGNITSRIEETTTVCTAPRDRPPSITRRINFSTEDVSKNVSDETMLMLHDDSRPRTLIGERYMPSEYPGGQGPLQYRDRSSQREKLEAEPAHSFNGISGATRQWRAPRTIGFLNDQTIPSYVAYTTGFSDRAQQTWPSAYSEQQRRKRRSQGTAPDRTSFPDRSQQGPSENLESDHRRFRSQSPDGRRSQFQEDLSSATRQRSLSQGSNPRRQQISQQSQNINNNSAPQFNDSPPRGEVSPSSRSPNGNAQPKSVSGDLDEEYAPFRNEAGSIKRSNDSVNKGSVKVTDEVLDDVTMPSSGEAATSSHRHVTLPSGDLREVSAREQIGDESAPTFASSDHRNTNSQRRSMPSSNIFDESAPTFDSTGRGTAYSQRQSMPSQNIIDESAPTFESTGRGTAYSQRQSLPANTQRKSMASANIWDESEPTFERTSPGTAHTQRKTLPSGTHRRSRPSQNICHESCPKFNCSGDEPVPTQFQTMPSQNINDESEPTFEGTGRGTAYSQRQSMPSQNIFDESAPTFESTGRGTAYTQRQSAQTRSMPSQNINDESEPKFHSTGRGTAYSQRQSMPSQNINDESKPLLESTGRGTAYSQRQSMPSQNIFDESAPTFESTGRGTAYSQRQSMAAYSQRQSMPSQNINDESEPTFESTSRGASYSQRQSMPSQNINDESEPTFESTSRGASYSQRQSMPSQNINDESEPKFHSTGRGTAYSQRQSMPSQNINDESKPLFDSSGRGTAYSQRQSMPSQNIIDESEPTFESTARGTSYSQRQSMGVLANPRSMPSQNINDESEPTFDSTGRGTAYSQRQSMPSQNINDESEPTFGSTARGTSYSQRQSMGVSAKPRSMPSQNINDESKPLFDSTGRGTAYSQRQSMPSKNIIDESAPTFESTGRGTAYTQRQSLPAQTQSKSMPSANIWDESEPTFESSSPGTALRQRQTLSSHTRRQSMPLENICAETCPNFNCSVVEPSTIPWQAMPSQNINDESAPTFESTGRGTGYSQRQSMGPAAQTRSMPSENINDESEPTFDSTGRGTEYSQGKSMGPAAQTRSMPSVNINDESEPTFDSTGRGTAYSQRQPMAESTQRQATPSKNLNDESEPTFESTGPETADSQRQAMPSQNINDESAPTFESIGETNEKIEMDDEWMSEYDEVGGVKRRKISRGQQVSMPSQNIPVPRFMPSGGEVSGAARSTARPEGTMPSRNPFVLQMTNECVANETIQPLPYVSEQPPLVAYQQTEQRGRPVPQRVSYASFSTGLLGNVNTLSHPSDTGGNQSCMCDGKREHSLGQTWTDRMDRSTTNKIDDVSMKAFNNLSVTPHHLLQMPKTCLDIATETPLQRRSQSLEYTPSENDSESDFLTCKSSTDLRQEDKGAIPCGICERVSSDRYFQSMDVGPHGQVVQGVTVTTSMSIISGTRLNQDQRMRAEVEMPNSMTNYDSIDQVMQSTGHKSTGTTTQNSCSMEHQNQNQKMSAEDEMLQSGRKNGYSNRSINGFDSMINYVSFDQVMQSTGHQSAGTPTQNNCSMEQQNYQPNQPCPGCPTGASHAMQIQRAWEQGFTICGSRLVTSPITITNYHSTGTTTQNDHSLKKRDFNPTGFAAECDQTSYNSVQACTCLQSQGGGSAFPVELPFGCSPDSESEFDSETECNADGFTARSSSPDEVEAGPHYDDYKDVEECNDDDNDDRSPGAYLNPSKAVLNSGANNCNCPLKSEDDSNARPYRPLRGSPGPFFYAVQDTGMWGITSAFLPEPAIAISPCLNGPCSLDSERTDDYQSARSSISNEEDRGPYRPPCWVYPSPIRMLFDGLVRLGESL